MVANVVDFYRYFKVYQITSLYFHYSKTVYSSIGQMLSERVSGPSEVLFSGWFYFPYLAQLNLTFSGRLRHLWTTNVTVPCSGQLHFFSI